MFETLKRLFRGEQDTINVDDTDDSDDEYPKTRVVEREKTFIQTVTQKVVTVTYASDRTETYYADEIDRDDDEYTLYSYEKNDIGVNETKGFSSGVYISVELDTDDKVVIPLYNVNEIYIEERSEYVFALTATVDVREKKEYADDDWTEYRVFEANDVLDRTVQLKAEYDAEHD